MFKLLRKTFLFNLVLFVTKIRKKSFFYYKVKNVNNIKLFWLLYKVKNENFTQWNEIEYLVNNDLIINFYEFDKIKKPKTRLLLTINKNILPAAIEKLLKISKKNKKEF